MEQFRDKIEEIGNYYEKQGFSPVASRIMVYLLLHPEGEATFEEIVSYFGVSKSAVSNAIKVLSVMEVLQEKTKSGARKRYFKATPDKFFSLEVIVKSYKENRLIFEDIRKLRKKPDDITNELSKITAFLKLLEKEYPKLHSQINKSDH